LFNSHKSCGGFWKCSSGDLKKNATSLGFVSLIKAFCCTCIVLKKDWVAFWKVHVGGNVQIEVK